MGCLAVEGTYDRMFALIDGTELSGGGVAQRLRSAVRAPQRESTPSTSSCSSRPRRATARRLRRCVCRLNGRRQLAWRRPRFHVLFSSRSLTTHPPPPLTVRQVMAAGADLNVKDLSGNTPLVRERARSCAEEGA